MAKTTTDIEKKTKAKKPLTHDEIVISYLNTRYPMWTNGNKIEEDLHQELAPFHVRMTLERLVNIGAVEHDVAGFMYQIVK